LIQIQTKTHLIFEKLDVKYEMQKKNERNFFFHQSSTTTLLCTCIWPRERECYNASNVIRKAKFDGREVLCTLSKEHRLSLTSTCKTRTNHFYFFIIFLFVKILNCPLFKLIITKKS
jgi:hypothetical protein